ncbi:hypothetical protein J2I47_13935 [Fibrella sp. HMF5335]|uniref:Uncharacterized protein n=1 Tax=Fibrella rubiginis TaxID=2817060 RepID=A0A939GJM1_9BACT|nr:hypothetical protein [Fibrella rubiginis]MBO0937653.1 hypothetical protein [Fibrella rubiginis]
MITQPTSLPPSAAQPDLIPGIYNYCDSWCERCAFTTRCRSFQMQHPDGPTQQADPSASLVHQLTEALNLTKRYIEKLHHEQGASMAGSPAPHEQQQLEEQAVTPRRQAKEHPASRLALAYLTQTGAWLADEKGLLEQAGHRQLRDVQLGIRTEDEAMVLLNELKDAYEQIRWYRTLIPVKTTSALRLIDEPTDDGYLLDYYNGKAKLVLVSIDQSLAAWRTMIAFYPEKVDDLLDLLATLSQLKTHVEATFPEARSFQRPGLD